MHLIPTDTITCTLGSARTVDVLTAYHDNGDPAQIGSKATAITSTTAATIVAAPPNIRDVDHISICNTDSASTTVEIKLVRTGGSTVRLTKVTLSAGAELHWSKAHGWDTSSSSTLGVPILVTLATSVNSSATHDTYVSVTGLSFAVVSGATYWFDFNIKYTSAATTTGSGWAISGPASPTALNGHGQWTLTATSDTFSSFTAYDIPAASNASSLTVGNVARLTGFITPSADGTVIARVISEVDSSLITALAGSTVTYIRLLDA